MSGRLAFALPPGLIAGEPPEARGIARDGVRMLVAYRGDGRQVQTLFRHLPEFLGPEDLLVINTSATLPAALTGIDAESGAAVVVHLSTRLSRDQAGEELWVVEPRRPVGQSTKPWAEDQVPERPGGTPATREVPRRLVFGTGEEASLRVLGPYRGSRRLWTGLLKAPGSVASWLQATGRPVRYGYVHRPWPLSAYQNVYANEAGSAEMPSAGRPFTEATIARLVAQGVGIAPVVLHTGVASLEDHEPPYPERVRVPLATARRVNATREAGGRVVAVGTTVVRALESAVAPGTGRVGALDGWTELVITPEAGVKVVDGLLTGWHEPQASHLWMIEAIAGNELLESCYTTALQAGFLWHEFGDVALLLP
jgi:S-adenosylmethionine:tRNA ribosyltransferase-isomerase